jgi:proteasome lid subunit RPN8/RPN11
MNNINVFAKSSDLLKFLKENSEKNLFTELCSLVGVDKKGNYINKFMQNRSKDPGLYFCIDPYDYLLFQKEYSLLFIFHSHLVGDEQPSEFDCKTSENCCYPFVIYSICTEKFCIYEPNYKSYDVNIIKEIRNNI